MTWLTSKARQSCRRALLAALMLLLPANLSAQFLHVKGAEIVDGDGKPVLLRGLGLGGWLMPEGYMLRMPGYGSPTSIRNSIIDLIGPDDARQFWQKYRAAYVNERDIELIANWGFNSIRLPFHYDLLTPADQPGVYLEEGFQVLDEALAWCKRHQLYLILDMHAAPGGQNSGNISDSDGTARLWTEPANQDRTVDIWRTIATRYADEPWIGGYDLLNEPVLPEGYSNLHLRDLYRRIAAAIREVDTNHIIFIEGNWYATDFNELTPPILYGPNIVYSFHKYWNATNIGSIQYLLDLRRQWNVPLWLGETGENSNPWFYEVVQLMEAQNIGWNWWTHKKIATTTSPLSSPITPGYQRVLDYWRGNAARPDAATARDGLFSMADNLLLERCESRLGVLPALLDPDFGTRHVAAIDNLIPGVIDCADYDVGTNNVAYFDADAKREQFENWTHWNQGGEYRNDGVDLERSRDPAGATYSVGWIADGEWLRYTVDIQDSGRYDIEFRIASLDGGGRLALQLDNRPLIADLAVPRTGGWYNWQSLHARDIVLPAGRHVLTLIFSKGGFNINRMAFDRITSSGAAPGAPLRFGLQPNYPNPFNPSTRIRFTLPATSDITLQVFDAAGREVRLLAAGVRAAGEHQVSWDGRDRRGLPVASGVYLYRLATAEQTLSRKLLLVR